MLPQLCHDAEPVDAGKHDVEDDDIVPRRIGGEPLERFFAIVDDVDVVPLSLEVVTQAVGQVLFVFDDEDAAHCGATSGSCTMNVLPCPGPPLSAYTFPPWRATTDRTMKSPRPVPLILVAIASGIR